MPLNNLHFITGLANAVTSGLKARQDLELYKQKYGLDKSQPGPKLNNPVTPIAIAPPTSVAASASPISTSNNTYGTQIDTPIAAGAPATPGVFDKITNAFSDLGEGFKSTWDRLSAGNIDDPNSRAYETWGAGRTTEDQKEKFWASQNGPNATPAPSPAPAPAVTPLAPLNTSSAGDMNNNLMGPASDLASSVAPTLLDTSNMASHFSGGDFSNFG